MLQTLVIGLGRSGAGLHLPVLARIRDSATPGPMATGKPIVACDPVTESTRFPPGVVAVRSIERALPLLDPAATVVHLCTPPGSRSRLLDQLAPLGFGRFVLEKPIATHGRELRRIRRIREQYGLGLVVVAPWLAAALTRRLTEIVRSGELGALRSLTVHQHKPRFHRSLTTSGHPTAFDVEIPHALPVALRLAGPAELVNASWQTLRCAERDIPRLGGARLTLAHTNGAHSEFASDLTSPRRERRITLRLEHGTVTANYPLSQEDDHAQLTIRTPDRHEHTVFRDDALSAFFFGAYRRLTGPANGQDRADSPDDEFDLHHETVRLLCAAKSHCEGNSSADVPDQRRAVPQHVG
ncbi:hypothetical protein [Amycolatopsis nigrescens]|uniref:hypothetical protein n=1 Tax=Amycolatopsis nigrescens TaxID=381445 RepID=UPI0003673197|nr:hypothetical protein [Amycolatopsis nigrescens]